MERQAEDFVRHVNTELTLLAQELEELEQLLLILPGRIMLLRQRQAALRTYRGSLSQEMPPVLLRLPSQQGESRGL